MAKTTIAALLTKIKRKADYNITDTGTDNILIDMINDALKRLNQMLLDEGLFGEIGTSTTLTTTADQEYVDLSGVTDLDEIICSSERTNDTLIQLIPYAEFKELYPDPTSNTSSTPNHASRYNNRLYLGPTPSGTLTIYFDYIKQITEIGSGDNCPFENKYDPLITAMVVADFLEFLDPRNTNAITASLTRETRMIDELVKKASNNISMNKQAASRRAGEFIGPESPRYEGLVLSYGYGVGIFGSGGFGR